MPLSLSDLNNTFKSFERPYKWNTFIKTNSDYSCPTTKEFIKSHKPHINVDNLNYYKIIRSNYKDFVTNPNNYLQRKNRRPKIKASEFSALKPEHVDLVKRLGINVVFLKDGRVQLIHNSAAADSVEDADEGASFMQEIISLSKQQLQNEQRLRTVSFMLPDKNNLDEVKVSMLAGPAQFGPDLNSLDETFGGQVVKAIPIDACSLNELEDNMLGKIVLVQRGNCMFIEKARNVQKLGAIGLIVFDNVPHTSSSSSPLFAMSSDGPNDVTVPSVFLYSEEAKILINALEENPKLTVKFDLQSEDDTATNSDKISPKNQWKLNEDDEHRKGDYLKDLVKIFDIFKSDKLKFDLLSSLNLKNLRDDNINMFMSLIQNLASPPSNTMLNNVKTNIISQYSKCWNPGVKSKMFIAYIHSMYSMCMS